MANVVVVGAQWGDEGKGKIVDWLSLEADVVVRFQGGHNAGHTLVIGDQTYKLSLLPSGVVRPGKLAVIGNGVVIDPWALVDEIERLKEQGVAVSRENLRVAENATLILPLHRELDLMREAAAGASKIGKEELIAELVEIAPKILPYVDVTWDLLDRARRTGKRILFEGAQGALLD